MKKNSTPPETVAEGFARTADVNSDKAEMANMNFDVLVSFLPLAKAGGGALEAKSLRDFSIEMSTGRAGSTEKMPSAGSKKSGEIRNVAMSRLSRTPSRGFL